MKSIIHVDNSEFFRKLVKAFLTGNGFDAESFSSAKEALEIVSAGQVGLVITGLSFSDMEGRAFIKQIIGFPTVTPVIALTGGSPDTEHELAGLVKAWVHKSGKWQEQLLPLIKQHFIAD